MAYSDQSKKSALPDKERHKLFYYSVVYGVDGDHATPYMTRMALGRLRFHIFHRGDADPDCHDHPWGFWTFPLVSYVEEVLDHTTGKTRDKTVPAFRWSYRPATYAHRVLYSRYLKDNTSCYRYIEEYRREKSKTIYTIVWAEQPYRVWGFWKRREGLLCWQYWKDYIFQGGKNAACGPKVPGDIANAVGDLVTADGKTIIIKGIVMVAPHQAEAASRYGWRKVRPDAGGAMVEIYRK